MRMSSRNAEQHKPVGRILRQVARPAPKPRKYELMIVVAPTITEDGLPAVVERVTGLIETQEGTVESSTHASPWGHRRLAYPIQNFRDAFYVLYYFDMAPRGIQELDRELRLDAAIIRHLIVKFDPLTVREMDLVGDEDNEDDSFAGTARAADDEPATTPAAAEEPDDDVEVEEPGGAEVDEPETADVAAEGPDGGAEAEEPDDEVAAEDAGDDAEDDDELETVEAVEAAEESAADAEDGPGEGEKDEE
jgi:small subunit ribosomal protein S6